MQYCKAKFCVRVRECKRYNPDAPGARDLKYKEVNGHQHCQHFLYSTEQVKKAKRK